MLETNSYLSWGRYFRYKHQVVKINWLSELNETVFCYPQTVLPYGNGRSYGDSCLNDNQILIDMSGLNRFIKYDPAAGTIECEAGTTLAQILELIIPDGWFLPVVPGTKFVTVGGAIANDIHGKNHHKQGSFGKHILNFRLLRSDRKLISCSPEQNADLFSATIGGLGLTGIITQATLKLKKVPSPHILEDAIRFKNLDGFLQLIDQSDKDYEYNVAWIDCLAKGKQMGRGIFLRGNHVNDNKPHLKQSKTLLVVPFEAPSYLLNSLAVKAFNFLYYNRQRSDNKLAILDFNKFFFPLDHIHQWNLLYGRRGFFQFQCVLPSTNSKPLVTIIETISKSNLGSFLSVLKRFGSIRSPGLLSFPKPGFTLALDFANQGPATIKLLQKLNDIVLANDGRVYPAKDAVMNAAMFKHTYQNWQDLLKSIDPKFSSSFWRRVNSDNQ